MKSLTIALDPDSREELYADVSDMLMDFIVIEAVGIIIKDFRKRYAPGIEALAQLSEAAQLEEFTFDPEEDIANSVELLVDVLKEMDIQDGNDFESPGFVEDDYSDFLRDKLALAISSITAANSVGDFMIMEDILNDPAFSQRIDFRGKHLNNVVMMFISGPLINEFI